MLHLYTQGRWLGKLDGLSVGQEGRKDPFLFNLKGRGSMAVSPHKGNHKHNALGDNTFHDKGVHSKNKAKTKLLINIYVKNQGRAER